MATKRDGSHDCDEHCHCCADCYRASGTEVCSQTCKHAVHGCVDCDAVLSQAEHTAVLALRAELGHYPDRCAACIADGEPS